MHWLLAVAYVLQSARFFSQGGRATEGTSLLQNPFLMHRFRQPLQPSLGEVLVAFGVYLRLMNSQLVGTPGKRRVTPNR